jgi:cellulose synthase/poly-beta-1,6-N-acetylglucosamine synthase-like glycosyltransferase
MTTMESLVWTFRTLNGFSLAAPMFAMLLFVLFMFWDYPVLLPYLLAERALKGTRQPAPYARALSTLVVIPSLLRKSEELASMMSTVESVATNGYPGKLLIVLSIDGTGDAPDLYAELRAWGESRHWNDRTWLYVTGTPNRRSKPMAIDHAMGFVKQLVADGIHSAFPEVYVSTDADADLGPNSLEKIVYRLQRKNPFTGAPARAVAGALHVRGNDFWRGWRHFFTISGQLNIQVARDYYVSNVGRHNIRWLPITGVPGAFYCTWTAIFLQIPRFMGYMRTLKTSHWLGWWIGMAPPRFSESTAVSLPELMAGDTDDTVTAYTATLARYENGCFSLDPPRTPLHAFYYMLRGILVDRALQYEPEARVYTSSPNTIKALMKQRRRWNTARIELTGRFWRSLGYHWMLGLPAIIVKVFMARSFLLGLYAYIVVPAFFWHTGMAIVVVLVYLTQVVCAGLLTLLALLMNGEMRYWRLSFALPLSPVYTMCFKWVPAAIGFLHDVFLFGNVTGFAPEATLIRGGSARIALLFRVRRAFLLAIRAVAVGDVPLGAFWFGWRETPWTPNGFEGFTSRKKPRAIVPPFSEWWKPAGYQEKLAEDGNERSAWGDTR